MTQPNNLERIGRYRILKRLGAGGMGEVFLAEDPNIDRRVALKTVRLEGTGVEIEERKQRLLREARAAGRLIHPNIVTLF
ncbi:MAG: serine/threonine protein kinase, partial [Thermoanaerobaculia bacterium]|nr:serine/threonine protein kinase [Thermoanaerobaculia bacterium]